MSTKIRQKIRKRSPAVPPLALLFTVSLCAGLSAGCFAHTPADPEESPALPERPDDGLPDSKMVFLGLPPSQWERVARFDCERDPAGNGCSRLFIRAADRIRWGDNSDEAPGLLVHACTQGHRPSCAAVDLLQFPSLDNAEALVRAACPRPFRSNQCDAAAALLSHSCNDKRQVAGCLSLAHLFAKAEPPDVVWMNRYKTLACAYGGFCDDVREEAAPPQHARSAD